MIGTLFEFIFSIPFLYFEKNERLKRKINRTKPSSSDDFIEGITYKLIGRVEPFKSSIKSPLNKSECVIYDTSIERSNFDWTDELVKDKKGNDFLIRIGELKCLVRIKGSQILLKKERFTDTGLLKFPDEHLLNYLKKHRISPKSFGVRKSFQFYEGTINIGDEVVIYGTGKWTKLNGNDSPIFQFFTTTKQKLVIADTKNKNSKL